MAFASIAALAAGEAATTALVLGAVSEVGIAMTVVGAVTGDKSLMKIGGVMGLVGGVGGMMVGASGGMSAAAASDAGNGLSSTAGSLTDATGSAGLDAATASDAGNGLSSGVSDAAGAASDAGSLGSTNFSSMVDDAQASLGDTTSSVSGVADPSTAGSANPASISAPSTNAPAGVTGQAVDARNGMDVNSDNFDAANNGSTAGAPGGFGPPTDPKNYFSNLLSWVKSNQLVTNGILKIGGDALKGMSERDLADQKMAQERNLANQRYGFGNQVASYAPRPLIGAH